MIQSSVILDVVLAAILVFSVVMGCRRGLFRTLAELLSYIVAYVVTSALAQKVSAFVAELIRPLVEARLQEKLAETIWNKGFDALPGFLQDEELLAPLKEAFASDLPLDLSIFVEAQVQRLAYVISFILLFIAVVIVLRLLIRVLDLLTKLPVIHTLNGFGGILIGAAKGLLLVFLVVWLAEKSGYIASEEALSGSLLLPYLQRILPL